MTRKDSEFTNEYALAKALLNGDRKAQHLFYDKYSGRFLGIIRRYIVDLMQAEDVMVECMMKIFDKVGQFGFNGSFEGWCRRIVVNEALMEVRKKKNVYVEIENVDWEGHSSIPNVNFEAEDLLKMIQNLPTGYRTVFNLYAIEGYSHAEICDLLEISESTSKSQLSRARKFLMEELKQNPKYGYSFKE
ncbi:MAG: RNA polymerase sigma factor [Leadbetterella sp.]